MVLDLIKLTLSFILAHLFGGKSGRTSRNAQSWRHAGAEHVFREPFVCPLRGYEPRRFRFRRRRRDRCRCKTSQLFLFFPCFSQFLSPFSLSPLSLFSRNVFAQHLTQTTCHNPGRSSRPRHPGEPTVSFFLETAR